MIERRNMPDGLEHIAESVDSGGDLVTLTISARQGLAIALRQHAAELREAGATIRKYGAGDAMIGEAEDPKLAAIARRFGA